MAGGAVVTMVTGSGLVPYRPLVIDAETPGTVGFEFPGPSVVEGGNGTTAQITFTVTRTNGTAAFDVDYATRDFMATVANNDYVATSGTLHFAEGQLQNFITVTVNGDGIYERSEWFLVDLLNATNGATIQNSSTVGDITNDDANHPSTVTASDIAATHGQVLTSSALFSFNDIDYPAGVSMSFWFRDNTVGGGHFELDGVAQPEGQNFGLTPQQLSRLTFRAGTNAGSADSITINSWDGEQSSNFATFNVTVAPNSAPTVSASDLLANRGQVIAAASLFGGADADGDALSYWFRDNTIGGGHFEYDGVAQAEGQTFGVSQSQLSHLTFRAGASVGVSDNISLNLWDGQASSSVVAFDISIPANRAPTVSAADVSATHGQVISAASLFSAADPDGDALSYWFRDNTIGGGHFEYDGVAQAEGQTFGVSQSQLSHLTFRAGASVSDSISLNLWDGQASSSVVSFNVGVQPNHAPTLSAPNFDAGHDQVISAASLFSAADADSDALSYWFRDNTIGGGRFYYDGVAQAEGQTFGVSQSQLSHLTFRATANSSDNISLNLWDGQASSSVATFNINASNHAPTATAFDRPLFPGNVIAAQTLVQASDADGDALSYWFRDNTPGGGHFEYDGIAQAEGQTFGVSQSQLSHLVFRAGNSGSDSISFNAWDGQASSHVVEFHIFV